MAGNVMPMAKCRICEDKLTLPYIQCAECPPTVAICLPCFATGSKVEPHLPWHSYKIIHANIPVISTSWTAIEDIKMLSAIERYGLDWELISSMLPLKSEPQCHDHYYKYFVNDPIQKALVIPQDTRYNTRPVSETCGEELSALIDKLPASAVDHKRGDWECRYDNTAEEDFMSGEGGEMIVQRLQVGIMEKYRRTLRRRKLLENLYYEYGNLLLETPPPQNPLDTPPRVVEEAPPPGTFPLRTMLKFTRFLTKNRFEDIERRCERVAELKKSITLLQASRRSGIRSRFGVEVHRKEKGEREMRRSKKHLNTKYVRDLFYDNNLSMSSRRSNVDQWMVAATTTK